MPRCEPTASTDIAVIILPHNFTNSQTVDFSLQIRAFAILRLLRNAQKSGRNDVEATRITRTELHSYVPSSAFSHSVRYAESLNLAAG